MQFAKAIRPALSLEILTPHHQYFDFNNDLYESSPQNEIILLQFVKQADRTILYKKFVFTRTGQYALDFDRAGLWVEKIDGEMSVKSFLVSEELILKSTGMTIKLSFPPHKLVPNIHIENRTRFPYAPATVANSKQTKRIKEKRVVTFKKKTLLQAILGKL